MPHPSLGDAQAAVQLFKEVYAAENRGWNSMGLIFTTKKEIEPEHAILLRVIPWI